MIDASSPKLKSVGRSRVYFTPKDLGVCEAVLSDAMKEMERSVQFASDDARNAALLRMASSILRRASSGERDRDALRCAALSIFLETRKRSA